MAAASGIRSTLQNVTDDQKKWLVFGIALNKVLITKIRLFVEQEIQKQYGNLQTSHSIHTQSTAGRLERWPTFLKYENINGNDAYRRLPSGRYNYSLFDCRVTSHVDFAKLYVENYMAKFNAFDEHCDASAVLNLLGKVPVFSGAVQGAAGDVRQARNAWAHCVFSDWDQSKFQQYFAQMEQLVKALGLPTVDEMDLLKELKDWQTKGEILCMNANIDPDLVKIVQHDVNALKNDFDKLTFEEEVNREKLKKALQDVVTDLEELQKRVAVVEHKVSTTQGQISALQSEQEVVQRRVTCLEDQQNTSKPQINYEIANCERDIAFFAGRHDVDTRQWLLKDFDKWVNDPGDSRAYVLLGDPGVGKSVIAGVLAHRSKKAGSLGATYFCRHNDGTRNDPRCLLGTVACQLCECNSEYTSIVGGEDGVRNLLGNYKLGVQELFTKLLQEPLGKCNLSQQRKLVVIDALDETQYESREDFLDLIMNRFPMLPKWLVFFITSRPENTVQLRLKKYNPCVRICAGNVQHHNFFQQHDQDIKLFLRKNVDVSGLPFSVDDVANKCKGSFLHAFYIAKDLNVAMQSGKSFPLDELFPGDFDTYLLKNFKRVFDKVGSGLFKKLFGCAIVAPAPLPVSFISYLLQKENSSIDKKHVLDALSLFMVLTETFGFLHNLIPAWLTDEEKAEELFINKNIEAKYLKDMIIEILFRFIHEESEHVAHIKTDLLDYVLSFGIRFLCGLPENDSLETVFNCLTSFKYLQNRIQSRRIESYSLIEDFRLAADCFLGDEKKEVLLGVCSALENDIFVLLECPHLLHVCLQNASEAVQKSIYIPENVSTPWLQWNSWTLAPPESLDGMSRYVKSLDGKLLAKGNGKSVALYDSVSLQVVLGPIKLSLYIKYVEFSPDGKFLFYGRLDEWLSVERGCVVNRPQFAGKNTMYEWGLFTRDEQCIVVKRSDCSSKSCCDLCMLNFLCLWAIAEIGQGQETETICSCLPHKLFVKSLYSEAEDQDFPAVPAMRFLLKILKTKQHYEWCCLLQKLQFSYTSHRFAARCAYCASRENLDTPTIANVRDFIIKHYSMIFKYQVWDVQTGVSALERAFNSGFQMSPFTYVCHLGNSLEECGVLFSGIDKSMSLCNIALLNTVCHHLIFFKAHRQKWIEKEFEVYEKRNPLEVHLWERRGMLGQPKWLEQHERFEHLELLKWHEWLEQDERLEWFEQDERLERLQRLEQLKWIRRLQQPERLEYLAQREHLKFLKQLKEFQLLKWLERLEQLEQFVRLRQHKRLECLERLGVREWPEMVVASSLYRSIEFGREMFVQFKQFFHLLWYRLQSNKKWKLLEAFPFCNDLLTNVPLELQCLPDVKEKGAFINMLPCVSPDGKWVAKRLDDNETRVHLYSGQNQRQHSFDWKNAVHVIKDVEHFAFTNDSMFFLYLTTQKSLHRLSLQTYTTHTSVSGVRPLFFIREKAQKAGYDFGGDEGDNIFFLKDFPNGFRIFIPVSGKPIQATFASADTIRVLCSDCVLTAVKTKDEGRALTTDSESHLRCFDGEPQQVKKCQFSQDGKLIAIHQGTKILFYDTTPGSSYHGKGPALVYEREHEFNVVNFTFSADSTFLLFWILLGNSGPSFFVWNVKKKDLSPSFNSPGLLSEDCCCCFSSDNKELIICTAFYTVFYIEIWDNTARPCSLLRKVETNVPCMEIAHKFTHCTVFQEDDLLACCIMDNILLYPLNTATHQSIFQLPRAHLGKIEFCQFLKGGRYLVFYGVDGMVFLWDLSECKAIAYAKIAQGRETIVSMAVSPEEDKIFCLTSFSRLSIIRLCGLKSTTLSKLPLSTAISFRGQVREPAALIQSPAFPDSTDISKNLGVAEAEELDFMLYSDDSEDSDEADELQD